MDSKRIPLTVRVAVLLAIILAVYGARYAANAAEPQCAPRQEASKILFKKYGETVVFHALSDGHLMWEWYANRETRTWTAVITNPDGKTCFIDSGDNWRDVAPKSIDAEN